MNSLIEHIKKIDNLDEAIKMKEQLLGSKFYFPGQENKEVAFDVINCNQDYHKKLQLTTMIGFLWQMCSEWEPEVYKWDRNDTAASAGTTPSVDMMRYEQLYSKVKQVSDISEEIRQDHEEMVEFRKEMENNFTDENLNKIYKNKAISYFGKLYIMMKYLSVMGREMERQLKYGLIPLLKDYPEVFEHLRGEDILPLHDPDVVEIPADVSKKMVEQFIRRYFEYDLNRDAQPVTRNNKPITAETAAIVTDNNLIPPSYFDYSVVDRLIPEDAIREDESLFSLYKSATETYDFARTTHGILLNIALDPSYADIVPRLLTLNGEQNILFRKSLCRSTAEMAVKSTPSNDIYGNLTRYMENNYEKMCEVTNSLYATSPIFDNSIIFYDVFTGNEKEREKQRTDFYLRYGEELKTSLKTAMMGHMTTTVAVEANRKRIEFLNKKTMLLKEILDQNATDQKLGRDMMRKRIEKLKAKNIRESGPDAPGLAEYTNQYNPLSNSGADRGVDGSKMDLLNRAEGDPAKYNLYKNKQELNSEFQKLLAKSKYEILTPDERDRILVLKKEITEIDEMLELPEEAVKVDRWINSGTGITKDTVYYDSSVDAAASSGEIEYCDPPLAPFASSMQTAIDNQEFDKLHHTEVDEISKFESLE